jgi:hypothetical protein
MTTTTQNIYNLTDAWTDGSTYTAIKMNVTDTSSNAASNFLDLQIGGTSVTTIRKNGLILFGNGSNPSVAGTSAIGNGRDQFELTIFNNTSGTATFRYDGGLRMGSGQPIGWWTNSDTQGVGSTDTTLSRNSAGIIGVNNAQSTNTGIMPGVQFATTQVVTSLLNNSSGAQVVFASANDVLSLAASTTYFFDFLYFINTGGTSHTTATEFTASSAFTSINYLAELWSTTAGTISTTAPSILDVNASTATVLNAASTATRTTIRGSGIIRTNAASTVTPKITFSAGPTGTCEVAVNSYFRCWPVGSNTVAAVGNWA